MLNPCLENIGEGLLHAHIREFGKYNGNGTVVINNSIDPQKQR
jgi:hypothetical protein